VPGSVRPAPDGVGRGIARWRRAILISRSDDCTVWLAGFGVLVGAGIGFGYSAATPPALKWFPPARTGMIAGLVVAGFGLAPVYLSPLSRYLLNRYGLQQSMAIFGAAFAVIVCGLAQLLRNPPAGFVAAMLALTLKPPRALVET
jgi:MFS family permease